MQVRTTGLVPQMDSFNVVDLYAYSTHGVPGLEIVGLGTIGRNIREKLIYLSRSRGLKFPLKRFVLCVDLKDVPKKMEELTYLELPLLLLYWSLTGHLSFRRLDECVSSGRLAVDGHVREPVASGFFQKIVESLTVSGGSRPKVISSRLRNSSGAFDVIDLSEVLDQFGGFKYQMESTSTSSR